MVRRWLFTQTSFVGDPDATLGRVEADMPGLVREALALPPGRPRPDGSFRLDAAGAHGRGVTLETVLEPVSREGARLRVPLRWAAASPTGPTFDGAFELERVGDARLELSLYGEYAAGTGTSEPDEMFDVTESTGRWLLRAVAAALGHDPDAGTGRWAPRLRVRDLMTGGPVVLDEDTPLRTAALVLLHRGVGGAPVVDTTGRPVGVLTETDLLVREAAPRDRDGARGRDEARRRRASVVGEACSRPPLTVHPETSAREAARRLFDEDVSRLVVVEDDRVVGILSRHDVLKALTRSPEELEAAVDAVLAEVSPGGLRAEVSAGDRAVVRGSTEWRTDAQEAVRAVAAVDGVTSVEDRVRWATDDVPRPPRVWGEAGNVGATA